MTEATAKDRPHHRDRLAIDPGGLVGPAEPLRDVRDLPIGDGQLADVDEVVRGLASHLLQQFAGPAEVRMGVDVLPVLLLDRGELLEA